MSLVKECYATVATPYGVRGEFYDDYGHRGTDYRRSGGMPVYAYASGVVGYVAKTLNLGGVVGMKIDGKEKYAGWAHLHPLVSPGDRVKRGDVLGYVAADNRDGWAGTHWDGAHIHTTLSGISPMNAALGVRPLRDPAPFISMYLTQGTAPADEEKEDGEMSKNVGFFVSPDGTIHSDPRKRFGAVINPGSGFITEFSGHSQKYYNDMAAAFNTGVFVGITDQHYDKMKATLSEVRKNA